MNNIPTFTTPFLSNLRSVPLWEKDTSKNDYRSVTVNPEGYVMLWESADSTGRIKYISESSPTNAKYKDDTIYKDPNMPKPPGEIIMNMEIQSDQVQLEVIFTAVGSSPPNTNTNSWKRSHTKPSSSSP